VTSPISPTAPPKPVMAPKPTVPTKPSLLPAKPSILPAKPSSESPPAPTSTATSLPPKPAIPGKPTIPPKPLGSTSPRQSVQVSAATAPPPAGFGGLSGAPPPKPVYFPPKPQGGLPPPPADGTSKPLVPQKVTLKGGDSSESTPPKPKYGGSGSARAPATEFFKEQHAPPGSKTTDDIDLKQSTKGGWFSSKKLGPAVSLPPAPAEAPAPKNFETILREMQTKKEGGAA